MPRSSSPHWSGIFRRKLPIKRPSISGPTPRPGQRRHAPLPSPETLWALAQDACERARLAEAAQDLPAARAWLDRACRIAPQAPDLQLARALVMLREGDTQAPGLLRDLADQHGQREAWMALALLARRSHTTSSADEAAFALGRAVAQHGVWADTLPPLLRAVAAAAGRPGWCGLAPEAQRRLRGGARILLWETASGTAPDLLLNNHPIRWPQAAKLAAELASGQRGVLRVVWQGADLLGSPLAPPATAPASPAPAAPPALSPKQKLARWQAGRSGEARTVLLISHAAGGGVARLVAQRCATLRAEGQAPVLLHPNRAGVLLLDTPAEDHAALAAAPRFALPRGLAALAALLAGQRPSHIELHHLLGHHPAVLGLAEKLAVPLEIWVHDYALFCPQISLLGPEDRYCGEPDLAGCLACTQMVGSQLAEDIALSALRARSAALLAAAQRVVVPARDVALRLQRHFPGVRPQILPWEDDAGLLATHPRRAPLTRSPRRIGVIGAIGVEKGYDVLLALARDAASRQLDLQFFVVGHSIDDAALLATNKVFITGRYTDAELPALLDQAALHVVLLPSILPETWCFALSHAWRAGLDVVAFDLGAQAERIRTTGRGRLLPLGLPDFAINDCLRA